MFKKLRTVIYHTADLEKAKTWYSQLTGIQPYFDKPFYVGFDIKGCELGLDPDMSKVSEGNHSVAYWAVDDIEDSVKGAVAEGAVLFSPVTKVGEGIKVAIINDPFGNAVGLIQEG